MRKLRTAAALAVTATVGLGVLAAAAPAAAATGTITVNRYDGTPPWSVTNPNDGDCYVNTNGAETTFEIINNTNRVIWIYSTKQCESERDTEIAPGGRLGPYFYVASIRVMSYS